MLGSGSIGMAGVRPAALAQVSRTQVDVFSNLYLVFLGLGTVVGVIVISYTLYNAYKYRAEADDVEGKYDVESKPDEDGIARPQVGEVPTGQGKGGGKKLFMSFGLSAILVLGLVTYSYSLLLFVESTPQEQEDSLEIEVTGVQFGWVYEYPNGHVQGQGEPLRVPSDQTVVLNVTSGDVWHNYGISGLRAKADAIPGKHTSTWFHAEETGEYEAVCYELCGSGHSTMNGQVEVMDPDEFEEWYENTEGEN